MNSLHPAAALQNALVIGVPNSGKSLLFNRLTGLNQKVANFVGATVEVKSSVAKNFRHIRIFDFPGTYTLNAVTDEEESAVAAFRKYISAESQTPVICVVDSTRLEQSLFFALQVMRECKKEGVRMIIAANMVDLYKIKKMSFPSAKLSKLIGCDVVGLSAKTGEGLSELTRYFQQSQNLGLLSDDQLKISSKIQTLSDEEISNLASSLSLEISEGKNDFHSRQSQFDSLLLKSSLGTVFFFFLMYLIFQAIFTWSGPLMDATEYGIESLKDFSLAYVSEGFVYDFLSDAIFGGFGSFVVFVPQIFILTFLVGLLEDSGYLSRAAILCHRPLRYFGLTGKSFIPLLSGVACAIPGVMAARTIDSPLRRYLTYFAVPLMPCSARLPVYTLLIAALIPASQSFGGIIGLQGLVMFAIYILSIFAALFITALISKFVLKEKSDSPFILEMPPFRRPSMSSIFRNSFLRAKDFLIKAGPTIFAVTVVIWFLGYFPNYGKDLSESYLGMMGQFIEPIFTPLGLDWRYGVAIISSFLAREVFVGTLGTLFGLGDASENVSDLALQVQQNGLSFASAVSLIVFFAIAMQCVSTLAVLKKETGTWKLPTQIFVLYTVLAYFFAFISYQLLA